MSIFGVKAAYICKSTLTCRFGTATEWGVTILRVWGAHAPRVLIAAPRRNGSLHICLDTIR
jgi:hypothetical protein